MRCSWRSWRLSVWPTSPTVWRAVIKLKLTNDFSRCGEAIGFQHWKGILDESLGSRSKGARFQHDRSERQTDQAEGLSRQEGCLVLLPEGRHAWLYEGGLCLPRSLFRIPKTGC